MKIRFWGVRGSIPAPGPEYVKYGGNTACIEVHTPKAQLLLDAGSGIREFGIETHARKEPVKLHLLISHTHWDHIMGFPFFKPAYTAGNEIHVYGPRQVHSGKSIEDVLASQMDYSYFPVRSCEMLAKIAYHDLGEETFQIEDATIRTMFLNHPIYMLAYRIEAGGRTIVYSGDWEPYHASLYDDGQPQGEKVEDWVPEQDQKFISFIQGVDLFISDAMYTMEEYNTEKKGWGHSTFDHNVSLAHRARVKRLALVHHEPIRTDQQMAQMEQYAQQAAARYSDHKVEVFAAREGMSVEI